MWEWEFKFCLRFRRHFFRHPKLSDRLFFKKTFWTWRCHGKMCRLFPCIPIFLCVFLWLGRAWAYAEKGFWVAAKYTTHFHTTQLKKSDFLASSMALSLSSIFLLMVSLRHYNIASYKISLGPFIMYHVCKSWLHQRFFYFFLLPMLQWEVSKWLLKRNVIGINLTMLQWLIMYVSFYHLYPTVAESSNLAT